MPHPIDRLIARLDLEPADALTFLGGAGPGGQGFQGRLYGGLVAAQAYIAAARTVDVGPIHSMHAYFLRPGRSSLPIRYEVEEIKQGKRFQTRQVRAVQEDQVIFQAMASFSADKPGVEHQTPMPTVPAPQDLPNRDEARNKADWREQPIDLRTDDPRGERREPSHWVWMRPITPISADPVMHTAILIFATDRALLRTAALPHQGEAGEFIGASLDHTIWFHGEVEFDDWFLHSMQSPVARHERGLVFGAIDRADGTRIATTAQEGALRFA